LIILPSFPDIGMVNILCKSQINTNSQKSACIHPIFWTRIIEAKEKSQRFNTLKISKPNICAGMQIAVFELRKIVPYTKVAGILAYEGTYAGMRGGPIGWRDPAASK
jgi:hypothetical protein